LLRAIDMLRRSRSQDDLLRIASAATRDQRG
jgi:hypothetical protein